MSKITLRWLVKRFWMFVYWASCGGNEGLVGRCTVSRISTTYQERELRREGEPSEEGPIGGRFVRDGLLAAKLALTLENFDLDCFHRDGFTFVSEKMRDAMGLGPSDIQYFEVDAS